VQKLLRRHLKGKNADRKIVLKTDMLCDVEANAVFPIAGRAAKIIRFEGEKPFTILSSSRKWVGMPVMPLSSGRGLVLFLFFLQLFQIRQIGSGLGPCENIFDQICRLSYWPLG